MKNVGVVLGFEYMSWMKSRAFRISTILVAVCMVIAAYIPTIISLFKGEKEPDTENAKTVQITIVDETGNFSDENILKSFVGEGMTLTIEDSSADMEALKEKTKTGDINMLFHFTNDEKVTCYQEQDSISQSARILYEKFNVYYKQVKMSQAGLSTEEIVKIETPLAYESVELGKNFMSSYIVSYAAVVLLYMTIVIYGQSVAMSVAREKASRAMELIVTSVKPTAMIYGKVLGTGLAGLSQLAVWTIVGVLSVKANMNTLEGVDMLSSIGDVAVSTLVYLFIFYILGFFVYAFLYAGLGSLVSKVEELNSATSPVMLILVAAYLTSILALTANVPIVLTITSFIPFFTPIVMFLRVSMYEVPMYQVIIAIITTALSCVLFGWISAKIYRVGVLMYGKPPKFGEVIKAIRSDKN